MSNPKYTTMQKQDFHLRLARIEESIPYNYSAIIHNRLGVNKDIIRNVRQGKTINFHVLEALEILCQSAPAPQRV